MTTKTTIITKRDIDDIIETSYLELENINPEITKKIAHTIYSQGTNIISVIAIFNQEVIYNSVSQ